MYIASSKKKNWGKRTAGHVSSLLESEKGEKKENEKGNNLSQFGRRQLEAVRKKDQVHRRVHLEGEENKEGRWQAKKLGVGA